MHLSVHKKGDPSVPRKAQLRFTVRNVSREKGVCLNWPAEGADTRAQLRFAPNQTGLGPVSQDGTSVGTNEPVEGVDLVIDAYDFGAWGTLHVEGTNEAKRPVTVKVRAKGTPDLDIPLDDDGNRIADAWQPADAKGKARDADDEQQEGNSHDGDGLTLYEEYRGFVGARAAQVRGPGEERLLRSEPGWRERAARYRSIRTGDATCGALAVRLERVGLGPCHQSLFQFGS